jgi:hypothetical protein
VLQINSGKLFTRPVGRENVMRGVLYTNAILGKSEALETAAGRLLSASSFSCRPQVILYEFTERIEGEVAGPSILVSHGVDPYLHDLAIVVGFALNCTCTVDVELTRRLTSGQRGLATQVSPDKLIRRVFDEKIWCKPDELSLLERFIRQLLGLERTTYLSVMRAIRTYVTGLHRLADDLELAYTLLVASVESLAQNFDGHKPDWNSYDERKRIAVDAALKEVLPSAAEGVRNALLSVEHTALGRRYREFVMKYVNSSYFREGLNVEDYAVGRSELAEVLGSAYTVRSEYVHQLKSLPQAISLGYGYNETEEFGPAKMLTLQGLARLMRHVIWEFVMRQPTIEKESYDYSLERAGIVQMRMAPEYWIAGVAGDLSNIGKMKLQGFFEQLAECLNGAPNAALTDIRPLLEKVTGIVPRLNKNQRRPYLALYVLFNFFAGPQKAPVTEQLDVFIQRELADQESEGMFVYLLLEKSVSWTLEQHRQVLTDYFNKRKNKSGLRVPRLFEAAATLVLAERYRLASDIESCREMVVLAVENHPGHETLRRLEQELHVDVPVKWNVVLLPSCDEGIDAKAEIFEAEKVGI